jgi:hypothetical protein
MYIILKTLTFSLFLIINNRQKDIDTHIQLSSCCQSSTRHWKVKRVYGCMSGVCRLVYNPCYCPSILIIIIYIVVIYLQRSLNEQLTMSIFHLCIIARNNSKIKRDAHLSISQSDRQNHHVIETQATIVIKNHVLNKKLKFHVNCLFMKKNTRSQRD